MENVIKLLAFYKQNGLQFLFQDGKEWIKRKDTRFDRNAPKRVKPESEPTNASERKNLCTFQIQRSNQPLKRYKVEPRTTVSQDVQTQFSVQFAFAKFLSKIKGNF